MSHEITQEQAQRDLLHKVHTEGVQVAYEAAVAVARDPNAPAPARATASATLFRVAGYFQTRANDAAIKQPHEMTATELESEIQRITARAKAKTPGIFD